MTTIIAPNQPYETYLKVLTSHDSIQTLLPQAENVSYRTVEELTKTLDGLAGQSRAGRQCFGTIAEQWRIASVLTTLRLGGREDAVFELAAEALQLRGEVLLPLTPTGDKFGAHMGHFMMLRIEQTANGHTLTLFNLGEGLQYAVPVAQRPFVTLLAGWRVVERMCGAKASGFKTLNALTVHVPQARFNTASLKHLCEVSAPTLPGSKVPVSEAIARVYDACKALGNADYCLPQRLQAPQDANTCMHKSAMAALSAGLREPEMRAARAAHIKRCNDLAPEFTEDQSLLDLWQKKTVKAEAQRSIAEPCVLAAASMPAVHPALAGPLACLLGSHDAETRAAMADCNTASVMDLAIQMAVKTGRIAVAAPGVLRRGLAEVVLEQLQHFTRDEDETRMTFNHWMKSINRGEALDELLPRPAQYILAVAVGGATTAWSGPLLHPYVNQVPFPLRTFALPTTGRASALLGAAVGAFGMLAAHNLALELDPKTRKPKALSGPFGPAMLWLLGLTTLALEVVGRD
jgi:hypothetical protein